MYSVKKKTCYGVCYTFFSVSLAYLRQNKSVHNNSCLLLFICFIFALRVGFIHQLVVGVTLLMPYDPELRKK